MNILVDAGIGSKNPEVAREMFGHKSSKLLSNLRSIGVPPRDIDLVVLTQLHFEHSGGATCLDRDGAVVPTFPKARYIVQKDAWKEAFDPTERSRPMYGHVGVDHLKVLEERGVVDFIEGDQEIVPGVRTVVTNGHSNGHQIIFVDAGSERLAYLSDLIPTPNHLPLPYITSFDRHPDETLKRKKLLLEQLEREGRLVVFAHGYGEWAGYLERKKNKLTLKSVPTV